MADDLDEVTEPDELEGVELEDLPDDELIDEDLADPLVDDDDLVDDLVDELVEDIVEVVPVAPVAGSMPTPRVAPSAASSGRRRTFASDSICNTIDKTC